LNEKKQAVVEQNPNIPKTASYLQQVYEPIKNNDVYIFS